MLRRAISYWDVIATVLWWICLGSFSSWSTYGGAKDIELNPRDSPVSIRSIRSGPAVT